jgi:hypothetical protein
VILVIVTNMPTYEDDFNLSSEEFSGIRLYNINMESPSLMATSYIYAGSQNL